MSTNAAFAGPVPGGRADSSGGCSAARFTGSSESSNEVRELERWYVEERAWPVRGDDQGRLWLEAGTEFDVVEVPEQAGRRALRRLIGYGQAALAPGPVAVREPVVPREPARCCFFVAPGARDDLPELLDWLDWGGIDLDMRAYGVGDSIPAPTADHWLHDPLAVPPEVIALLATIAESCSRYALTRRARENTGT